MQQTEELMSQTPTALSAFPDRTALEDARAEIATLYQRPDLKPLHHGCHGHLSPEEVIENDRRDNERCVRRCEIIVAHGIEQHYLTQLRTEAADLEARLASVRREISLLEDLSKARDERL